MEAKLSAVRFKRLKWLVFGSVLWATVVPLPMQEQDFPEWVFGSSTRALLLPLVLSCSFLIGGAQTTERNVGGFLWFSLLVF